MRIAALNEAKLHWKAEGDPEGMPIVFANSLGTDLRLWDQVVPLLSTDLRILRFDKRGHGLSSCPAARYSMDDLVNDTEQLLDHLAVKNCVFVGLSIGGMIGQALAFRRPDLIKVMVLSNTAARMGTPQLWQDRIDAIMAGGMEAVADSVLERWFTPAFRGKLSFLAWRNMLCRTPQKGYLGCCHAIAGADLSEVTKQLRLPVIGIAGSDDGASPPDVVESTVRMIPGSRFTTIQNAGHLPCVETPEEYASILNNFIQETSNV